MTSERKTFTFSDGLLVLLMVLPWINPLGDWPVPTLQPMLLVVTCISLMAIVMALVPTTPQALWRAVCTGWVIAAGVNTAFALLQYLQWDGSLHPWVSVTPPDQVFGNVRQRNLFATLCAMGLAAVVWLGHPKKGESSALGPERRWRRNAGSTAAFLGAGLAISGSRTGMVELAVLWCLAMLWAERAETWRAWCWENGNLCWASLAYGIASGIAVLQNHPAAATIGRLIKGEDVAGCAGRKVIWLNAWQLIMQKPWRGWGWGEFGYAQFMNIVDGARVCNFTDNAHNLPLHIAVTLGVPIALLIMFIVGYWIYRARPWLAPTASQQLAWALLALIALHSLLEYPLWYGEFQLVVALSVWYLYGCRLQGESANEWLGTPVLRTPVWRTLSVAFAGIALVVCGLVADSYSRVQLLFVPPQLRPVEFSKGVPLKRRDVMLFTNEVSFASLSVELTPENAQSSLDIASHLLHGYISPFGIERVIASLNLLDRTEEAQFYEARYAAALPDDYAKWLAAGRKSNFFKTSTTP